MDFKFLQFKSTQELLALAKETTESLTEILKQIEQNREDERLDALEEYPDG